MTHPTVKLGDVAEFIRGITFKPDDVVPVGEDDAVVCMRTKNVQTLLDYDDLLAVPSQFVRRKDQYLHEGDILVSSANSWNLVGKCCWVPALPWRAAFGGFISVLRGDSTRVDRRYLYWWFASERIEALLRSFGQKTTNISNLNIDRCLQLALPLPPIPEQRRIASILDKADALRTRRREALAQLDRLAQSIFVEMFGDPVTNPKGWRKLELGEIFGIARGGSPRPIDDYITDAADGVNWVMIGDTEQGGKYIWSTKKKIRPEGVKRSRLVKSGDFLLTNSMSFGRPYILKTSGCIHDGWLVLSPRVTDFNADYFYTLLGSQAVFAEFSRRAAGATVKNLNIDLVAGVEVAVPPLEEQRKFAKAVEAIEAMKSHGESSASQLDSLFGSLQVRAFSGEL